MLSVWLKGIGYGSPVPSIGLGMKGKQKVGFLFVYSHQAPIRDDGESK